MQTEHFENLKAIANSAQLPDSGDLVTMLGNACLAPDRRLGQSETTLLGDILHQLIRDVEMPVRQALAEQLSERNDAPQDLITVLADDVIDVAYPILQNSPILQDQDLIGVVQRHARQHAIAVSRRETVSEAVSSALVDTGDANVVVSLLQNDGAQLSPETMNTLVSDSESIEAYRAPLLGRKDLDLDMAMRMADWVGDSLRQYIAERFNVDPQKLDKAVSDAVLEAIDSDIFENKTHKPTLDIEGEEPGPRLLHALTHDNLTLFKQTFEGLCEVNSEWAENSLYCSGEALAIASRAIGLNQETYARILCHLHSNEIFADFQASEHGQRMMQYFDSIQADNAQRVLNGWRATAA